MGKLLCDPHLLTEMSALKQNHAADITSTETKQQLTSSVNVILTRKILVDLSITRTVETYYRKKFIR